MMTKLEAYRILAKMWNDATPEQDEAINIAMDCIEFVDLMPDDMVAVVRCRECKYWQDNNGGYPNDECRWGKGETPDADDYCSYGERKEADGK